MFIDAHLEFCDNVAANTGAPGTYGIGKTYDLQDPRDIGNGQPLYLVLTVTETFASAGAATVQFQFASDSTEVLATDGSASQHYSTPAFAVADLTIGKVLTVIALPMEGVEYEQFIGMLQVTGTAALEAGRIDAFLTRDVARWKAYPAQTAG